MIFNTTYANPDYIIHSNELLGKSYSFYERIQMRGVGSGRFVIAEISEKLNSNKEKFSELNYANMELRPRGIIVHYTQKQERFSWCIPFHKLVIYNTNLLSIHAEGNYLKFFKNNHYKSHKKFLEKMNKYRIEYLDIEYYDR